MGRMGVAAYDALAKEYEGHIVGVELDDIKAQKHQEAGRHVVAGDATNPDFWNRAKGILDDLESVMLTLPSHEANLTAAYQLQQLGYEGFTAATFGFEDEEASLKDAGVDMAFNIYAEAGQGFATDLRKIKGMT
jgi:Trk K+ transport system NAD-binding subunit